MPFNSLQRQLERIYEVQVPHAVEDFLVTDPAWLNRIEDSPGAEHVQEKLLVRQDGDDVEVALFLHRELVERLHRDDPVEHLHRGNFADLCLALEGVSHFLYLTWNAGFDRAVSLLELEMQAEVDKYVTTAFLFGRQAEGRVPSSLYQWLFQEHSFDRHLDARASRRYRDASRYAGKFCSRIESRYLRAKRPGSLVNELRRFYRLPQREKISCIESAG